MPTAPISPRPSSGGGGASSTTGASSSNGTTTTTSAGGTTITRSISACSRCRTRKTKCDQHFPTCGACAKAKVECVGIDAATGREVPRSYVWALEKRVKELEAALGLRGLAGNDGPPTGQQQGQNGVLQQPQEGTPRLPPIQEAAQHQQQQERGMVPMQTTPRMEAEGRSGDRPLHLRPDIENLVSTIGFVSMKGTSQPSYLGQSSGLSFARLMFATVKLSEKASVFGKDIIADQLTTSACASPLPLPTRSEAKALVDIYFQQANPQTPILFRPGYDKFFNAMYERVERSGPSAARPIEIYFLHMVCGIACAMSSQSEGLPERHHATAIKHIDSLFSSTNNRQDGLKGLLLLALYSFMRPTAPGVWYIVGACVRLAVDLGLHQEGCRGNSRFEPLMLDERRRLFWCTYSLDRQICVYLGRPFSIPEESIRTPFPTEAPDSLITSNPEGVPPTTPAASSSRSSKTIANFMFAIRRLQSEMQTVLYQGGELPRRFETLAGWRQDMQRRLSEWEQRVPKSREETNCGYNFAFVELNLHQSRLLLYGLAPASPQPDEQAFLIIEDAAKKIFLAYKKLKSENSINYTWLSCHNLFMAGTSYLCALWHCPAVRGKTDVAEVQQHTETILDILAWMTPRCAAAVGCREVFDKLSRATIERCRVLSGTSPFLGGERGLLPPPHTFSDDPTDRIKRRRVESFSPHYRNVISPNPPPLTSVTLPPPALGAPTPPLLPDISQFSSPAFPAETGYSATNPSPLPPPALGLNQPSPLLHGSLTTHPQQSQTPPLPPIQPFHQHQHRNSTTSLPDLSSPTARTPDPLSMSHPSPPRDDSLSLDNTAKLWELMTEVGGGALWDQAFFAGGSEGSFGSWSWSA
ncbi:hypothetical protein BJ508DRAFT_155543 [Ascobolus immersus RN42]|uniref:Zn(2)-C6 fungal-type domain-containing protein n=1 Tax=Ascobolus immersus RN42 TaxID=1160509 RepID=A0A3N4HXH9_ASCIM|nr:hypothetical protein BJ508DRAFT_155543 [Ascobolus immersus RN42]